MAQTRALVLWLSLCDVMLMLIVVATTLAEQRARALDDDYVLCVCVFGVWHTLYGETRLRKNNQFYRCLSVFFSLIVRCVARSSAQPAELCVLLRRQEDVGLPLYGPSLIVIVCVFMGATCVCFCVSICVLGAALYCREFILSTGVCACVWLTQRF